MVLVAWMGLGGAMAADVIDAKDATIKWAFDKSADNASAAEISVDGAISTTSFSLGEKLYFNGLQSGLSKLNPTEKISNARDDASYVVFSIVPKKGVTFTPKSVAFKSQKCGTSGGTLDVVARCGEKSEELVKGFGPERNSVSESKLDITSLTGESDKVELYFYVYNLAGNKQLALGDVVVTGDLNGTPVTTTATSCEYEAGNEYLIQAVNEYGGLSKAAKADVTSAVESVETADATFKATAVYTIDGKRIADTAKGINVITDGKTSRKVVMK